MAGSTLRLLFGWILIMYVSATEQVANDKRTTRSSLTNKPVNQSLVEPEVPWMSGTRDCEYDGKIYKHKEGFMDSQGCNNCWCRDGAVFCTLMLCYRNPEYLPGVELSPHLVVKDGNDKPCLLATLNATLKVSYRVYEYIIHQKYLATADIQLPADVEAQGVCGGNVSHLALHWGNDTLHVNLTFSKDKPREDDTNITWALTGLSVTYNLSDSHVFPGAAESDAVTVDKTNLHLFQTPVGVAYDCDRDVSAPLGDVDGGVTVLFHHVKLAAFVNTAEFPIETKKCPDVDEDVLVSKEGYYLVSIYVATGLVFVVIGIVVIYVIVRRSKEQKARDQSEYRPM